MQGPWYRWLGGVGSLLALAACAGGTSGGDPQASAAAPSPEARCDDKATQAFIGQPFNNETLARVRAATGAQDVRQLRPDSMVTKEFKLGRVNVVVDASQRVTRVYCG